MTKGRPRWTALSHECGLDDSVCHPNPVVEFRNVNAMVVGEWDVEPLHLPLLFADLFRTHFGQERPHVVNAISAADLEPGDVVTEYVESPVEHGVRFGA